MKGKYDRICSMLELILINRGKLVHHNPRSNSNNSKWLPRAYYMSVTVLNAIHLIIHVIFTTK